MPEQRTLQAPAPERDQLSRRRHFRVACRLPVEFQIKRKGCRGRAPIVNLGLGGARLELPVEIDLPTELQIEIPLEASGGDTIALEARVIWTCDDGEDGSYPTGVQFTSMKDGERRQLYDLIRELGG